MMIFAGAVSHQFVIYWHILRRRQGDLTSITRWELLTEWAYWGSLRLDIDYQVRRHILNNPVTRYLFAGWGLKAAVLQVFLPSSTLLSTNYCKKKVEFVVVGCEWIWWGALLRIYQWAPFVATQFFCALTSIGLSPYCCVRTPLLESVHSLWVYNTSRKKMKALDALCQRKK